jgi:hypothetical protein
MRHDLMQRTPNTFNAHQRTAAFSRAQRAELMLAHMMKAVSPS